MWSEEKAVHPLAYDSLPLPLRKEIKSSGVLATSWRYQPVAGYDVWFVMNAWEMAKLRRYYLLGEWDGGFDMWNDIWLRSALKTLVRRSHLPERQHMLEEELLGDEPSATRRTQERSRQYGLRLKNMKPGKKALVAMPSWWTG